MAPDTDPGRSVARGLVRQVVGGAVGTLVLNVTTVLANFGTAILLGRTLGTSGYGIFAFALAWSTLLSVPAVLGLPPLIIRKVAEYNLAGSWSLLRGLLRRANQFVGVSSVCIAAGAALIGWLVEGSRSGHLNAFWLALLLIPIVGMVSVRQAAMQGLGRVVLGRVPATLVAPVGFLAAAAVSAALAPLTPSRALALNVVAAGMSLVIVGWLLARTLPPIRDVKPAYEEGTWLRAALPLVAFSGIQTLGAQASVLLLGLFRYSSDVGVYSVAARGAAMISFLLMTVRYPVAPTIARLNAVGDRHRMQQVVTRSAQGTLLLTLPLALGVIIFADQLLGVFGSKFDEGALPLRILAVGELVNVVTGLAGNVLVMTGNELLMTKGIAIGTAVSLCLNLILIPLWGPVGAAVATASGVATSNLILVHLAWRAVRIYSTPVWLPLPARFRRAHATRTSE